MKLTDFTNPYAYRDDNKNNLAHYFVAKNNLDELKKLIDHEQLNNLLGISLLNLPNRYGQTPLHLSLFKKDPSFASELIKAGADISLMDCEGKTPFHYAQFNQHLFPEFEPRSNQIIVQYRAENQNTDIGNNDLVDNSLGLIYLVEIFTEEAAKNIIKLMKEYNLNFAKVYPTHRGIGFKLKDVTVLDQFSKNSMFLTRPQRIGNLFFKNYI